MSSTTGAAAHETAERFFDVTLDLACVADRERLIRVNHRWTQTLGWSEDELVGRPFLEFVHPDDRPSTVAKVDALMRGETVVGFENRYATNDGHWRTLVWNSRVEPDSGLILASARDVTIEHELKLERDRLNRLLSILSSLQTTYIESGLSREWWTQALDGLIELTDSEYGFVGRVEHDEHGAPFLVVYAITDISWNEWSRKHFAAYAKTGMEFRNLNTLFGATLRTGETVIANDAPNDPRAGGLIEGHLPLNAFAGIPLSDPDGMVGMIGLANRPGGFDERLITWLEPLRAMLAQIISRDLSTTRADTDPLTGLANRAAFMRAVHELLDRGERRRREFGVLLIDLDGFKEVNDQLGHMAGDRVLIQAAERAQSTLRADDLLARIGGDEFAVVLPDCSRAELSHAGERLRDAIAGIDPGTGSSFGASVGGVIVGADGDEWSALYELADSRLYVAKGRGGNAVVTDA